MGSLIVSLASVAWVTIKSSDAVVSMTRGYYAQYAGSSFITNGIAFQEISVFILYLLWSLTTLILALSWAGYVWTALDNRLAEAAVGSIGIETPLDWDKAIKASTLLMIVGLMNGIVAYSLGQIANPIIGYYDQYDNKEN